MFVSLPPPPPGARATPTTAFRRPVPRTHRHAGDDAQYDTNTRVETDLPTWLPGCMGFSWLCTCNYVIFHAVVLPDRRFFKYRHGRCKHSPHVQTRLVLWRPGSGPCHLPALPPPRQVPALDDGIHTVHRYEFLTVCRIMAGCPVPYIWEYVDRVAMGVGGFRIIARVDLATPNEPSKQAPWRASCCFATAAVRRTTTHGVRGLTGTDGWADVMITSTLPTAHAQLRSHRSMKGWRLWISYARDMDGSSKAMILSHDSPGLATAAGADIMHMHTMLYTSFPRRCSSANLPGGDRRYCLISQYWH